MALLKISLVLLLNIVLENVSGRLELTTRPKSKLIKKGDSYNLICESAEPFVSCQWKAKLDHTNQNMTCVTTNTEIENNNKNSCKDNNNLIWDLTNTRCGITIQNVKLSDIGIYRCTVIVVVNEIRTLKASANISVASPAIVSMTSSIVPSLTETVAVGTAVWVKCDAVGAYPKPTLEATIGNFEGSSVTLTLYPKNISEKRLSATFQVYKNFTFIVERKDCGQYLNCETEQTDNDGNLLFSEKNAMPLKLACNEDVYDTGI